MKLNSDLFKNGETIAVATSGGEDSMSLLHYLNTHANQLGIRVICVNVEHGIRGSSSLNDTSFVKQYCEEHNIAFYGYTVDAKTYSAKNGVGIEESARILRYDCFAKLLESGVADKIATAHHLSDNAETMLLNMLRGTSLSGLYGMKLQNNNIIRPLLNVSKKEIQDYITENNIPYVTDETNFVSDNKRNFLRLEVIPKIKQIFPDFENSFQRLSVLVTKDEEYLQNKADELLTIENDTVKISLCNEEVLFSRAVVKAFIAMGITKDYTKKHVDAVFSLLNAENGKKIQLPENVDAVREYDCITFYKRLIFENMEMPFALGTFNLPFGILTITRSYEEKPNYKKALYFDLDKIPENTVIRFRKDGDVFNKFGGKKKNLGDYMTDKKLPLRTRDTIPVVANGNNVLILGQVEISDDIKVDKTTEIVVKLEYKKNQGEN